jgi:CxxC motif-containing protein (DUF1111 family)
MKRIRNGMLIFTALLVLPLLRTSAQIHFPREAPAGFDNQTNGYLTQADFDDFQSAFNEVETPAEGLGPTFNDTGCKNCHNAPVSGGGSTILETRAGSFKNGTFIDHAGGSLVQSDIIASCPVPKEQIARGEDTTRRASINTLGDGYIEAIPDAAIVAISRLQPPEVRGLVVNVPILEAKNVKRVGRFGWKNQHASLTSFSADAYLNEMGITSPMQSVENTVDGKDVSKIKGCDMNPENPDDDGEDVDEFANFMRSTKVPPRGPISTADDIAGQALFVGIGCATCHIPIFLTAPAGTVINGGTFTVPDALGNKIIHPFSDFLLHDVGVPDPIVQNGGPETYNKVRTPPLWGLRKRTLLMHDGGSSSIADAIHRHGNQAAKASSAFRSLSDQNKQRLLTFLGSL